MKTLVKSSRRNFLKSSGQTLLGSSFLYPGLGFAEDGSSALTCSYPDREKIIKTAVDAAVAAGASYADTRLTHIEEYGVGGTDPTRRESMAFGVRALYKGYWGFASSPVWSTEEGVRLGQAAVYQARANVLGDPRIADLAPNPDFTNGHWETPIKDDPFQIDYDEMRDFAGGVRQFTVRLKHVKLVWFGMNFIRVNKAFGSSHGQYVTQTLFSSSGHLEFRLEDKSKGLVRKVILDKLTAAGEGFEYFRDRPLRQYISEAHEEALQDLYLPVRPVDVGRHNVLIDQLGTARLVSHSIGTSAEVDRVLGFEANAGGTSYITDPDSMLGSFKIGSSLLNVSCDRSELGSVGRVKWDDEGVTPVKYDLVKDGILVDLHTNREGATWIGGYMGRTGRKLQSYGCSYAPSALDAPLIHKPDIYMQPDSTPETIKTLRESIESGIELKFPDISMDFQQTTGLSRGLAYEIRDGKRVALLQNAGMIFRTSELWSNIIAMGGLGSVMRYGLKSEKGQPSQTSYSSVYTPPTIFKEMTFIDVTRKA